MKGETQPDSIVGRFEIGQIIGVSRQGVATVVDHPDFPPPICRQGKNKSPLFYRRDVEAFKAERDAEAERKAAAPATA